MTRVPSRRALLVRLLVCLLVAGEASVATRSLLADCGGFTINTVAPYKKPARERAYLFYAVKDGVLLARMNAIDEHLAPTVGGGPVRMRYRGGVCVVDGGWQVDPSYRMGDPYSCELPYRLSLATCPGLAAHVPAKGFLIANLDERTVQLPLRELPVTRVTAVDERIAREVDADLAQRSFDIETYSWVTGPWHAPAGRIPKDRIVGRKITALQVGGVSMVIASLRIDRALELYPPYGRDELRGSVRAEDKVDFPVIYFTHPAHRTTYFVGDGSHCSSANFKRYEDASVGAVGELNRFEISRALDLDGDGIVDVLHINESFAFSIDRKGHVEAIDLTFDC